MLFSSHLTTRFAAVLLTLPLCACSVARTIDRNPDKLPSTALPAAEEGRLTRLAASTLKRSGATKEESAFLLVPENAEALRWRLALADNASTSIDAQYYIWQSDLSATLLLEHILDAADRGVRVRLLVDDFALAASDKNLAALDSHPNVELRLFNPTLVRRGVLGPLMDWVGNFSERNRRMHNKLFLVDGRFAIVGGRNIGDEYFGLSEKYNFRDLDVLTCGPVVEQVAEAFDDYWNSDPTYPADALEPMILPGTLEKARERVRKEFEQERARLASFTLPDYLAGQANQEVWEPLLTKLADRAHTGEARFIQDEPVLHRGKQVRLTDSLHLLTDVLDDELIICSPYLIPSGEDWQENLREQVSKGDVKVLTASLASGNHSIVNSKYKKYRRPILETGSRLFEFRPDPANTAISNTPPVEAEFISLHTKTILADRERAFIGSLNLDPRAVIQNTENGLLIDSAGLGGELQDLLHEAMGARSSWEIDLDETGRLQWVSHDGTRHVQPARNFRQRIVVLIGSLLPIESQL